MFSKIFVVATLSLPTDSDYRFLSHAKVVSRSEFSGRVEGYDWQNHCWGKFGLDTHTALTSVVF